MPIFRNVQSVGSGIEHLNQVMHSVETRQKKAAAHYPEPIATDSYIKYEDMSSNPLLEGNGFVAFFMSSRLSPIRLS